MRLCTALALLLVNPACGGAHATDERATTTTATSPVAVVAAEKTPAPDPLELDIARAIARAPRARFVAIGGGATPDSTQVQIEQDIGLAREVLGEDGVVLFGAGAAGPIVQVQRRAPRRDAVAIALADLFAPRGGRDAEYRRPVVQVDAPARAEDVLAVLSTALREKGAPLLVYIAGHGQMGLRPRDNSIALWGQSELRVEQLAASLTGAERGIRLVATTCFSGGFAELAFARADENGGGATPISCGLFASTWDLEAAGCDPDPDRSNQEGYGLHFLRALAGSDRDGTVLPPAELDFDGDGTIGLLDAHTRVRIASTSGDVPTTTSERWLRRHAPTSGAASAVELPHEDAVISALAPRLGLAPDLAVVRAHLDRAEVEIESRQHALDQAHADEDEAYRAAAAAVLARWPVLDDPWHPDFADLFRGERDAIAAFLDQAAEHREYLARKRSAIALEAELADLRGAAAPVERLLRALENRELAGRLARKGGREHAIWRGLLACERDGP